MFTGGGKEPHREGLGTFAQRPPVTPPDSMHGVTARTLAQPDAGRPPPAGASGAASASQPRRTDTDRAAGPLLCGPVSAGSEWHVRRLPLRAAQAPRDPPGRRTSEPASFLPSE